MVATHHPARQVNVHEAKTHLSRLLDDVQAGQDIIIARAGKPIARLVPLEVRGQARPIGLFAGQTFRIADDFDQLPADIAEAFGG